MTVSAGTVSGSTPERASDALQWTVTSSLYQPALLGAAVAAPLSEGGVRSMLMSSTVVSVVLPALSTAVPVADWPALSFESVTGSEQPATPDSSSEQSKVTVTGVLFQPKPFAAGRRLPLMVGGIPSIFSVTEWPGAVLSSWLPALSVLQKVISWMPFESKSKASEYV